MKVGFTELTNWIANFGSIVHLIGVHPLGVHWKDVMTMIEAAARKGTRLSIRATSESKELLEKAARKENKSLSDFVLDNAVSAAEAILADDANFSLSKREWNRFIAALDAPPRNIPTLRKLLIQPGVFDAE